MRWFHRKRGRKGANVLFVIIGLLVCSAVLRLGGNAGTALASAIDAMDPPERSVAPQQEGLACHTPEDLRGMVEEFQKRDAAISQRERAVDGRLEALRIADEEVSAKLAALQKAEADLRDTIALADTAAENDIDRLTRVYENMKPKQAAALFEEMDPNFAAGFLGRMRPEAAAQVMAGLSPEAAHLFSVVLAGRNAEVPTE